MLLLILVLMVTVAYDQCIFFCFIEVSCPCSCGLVPTISTLGHFIIIRHLGLEDPLPELLGVSEHRSFLECVDALRRMLLIISLFRVVHVL